MRRKPDAATEFLRQCEQDDPERYKEVCDKYTVLSSRQWRTIHEREVNVGLLGVQPARIDPRIAHEYGLESLYEKED